MCCLVLHQGLSVSLLQKCFVEACQIEKLQLFVKIALPVVLIFCAAGEKILNRLPAAEKIIACKYNCFRKGTMFICKHLFFLFEFAVSLVF